MKRVLIAGDSFFCSDPNWPNQHFSELLGDDVEVTNVSGTGFTNTAIMGQTFYGLNNPIDYCILGFTSVDRLPIEGPTDWALNDMHVQWRSTNFGASPTERRIIDDFLSLTSYSQLMVNNLAIVERTLQLLKEQNIPFVWALGGMYEVWQARCNDELSIHPSAKLIDSISSKYGDKLVMIDYWKYPTLLPDPIFHIKDRKYQQMLATEFKKVLGL